MNDAIDKILQARRTTCFIVAHRLSTIARAERIVVLEGALSPRMFQCSSLDGRLLTLLAPDGRITESGTYRELVSQPDSRFRTLMAAQLGTAEAVSVPVRP